MKLGVVGKGGVGKTTVAALVARTFADRGRRVVAIDTDSNPNIGMSLGLSAPATEAVPVLPRSLVVGTGGDLTGEELMTTYARDTPSGVRLLSAIRVTEAGAGCMCGGHKTVRNLLGDALTRLAEVTVVDMEAGLEHLTRSGGTLAHADVLLIVMEPTHKSVVTAARTVVLAEELGIPRAYGLGNKAHGPDDAEFFADTCREHRVPLLGVLPYDQAIAEADRAVTGSSVRPSDAAIRELDQVVAGLENAVTGGATRA